MLEDTENWLYEDGEDQPKQVYMDKLQELKVRFCFLENSLRYVWGVWDVQIVYIQLLNEHNMYN